MIGDFAILPEYADSMLTGILCGVSGVVRRVTGGVGVTGVPTCLGKSARGAR